VSGPPIPPGAIQAAAEALREYMPGADEPDRWYAAQEALEAAEAAWPHDPPSAVIPPAAVTAAEQAIRDEMNASREIEPDRLARAALEAAAPLTDAERKRCAQIAADLVRRWRDDAAEWTRMADAARNQLRPDRAMAERREYRAEVYGICADALEAAEAAWPHERDRILALARKYRAVVPADEGSRARWASFADLVETLDAKEAPDGAQ